MRIVTEIKPLLDLTKIKETSVILMPYKPFSIAEDPFDLDSLLKYSEEGKSLNYKTAVLLDAFIQEEELNDLKIFLDTYNDLFDYIYYTDNAVYSLSSGFINKLVYFDEAVISSSEDNKAYLSLGIDHCLISPYCSIEEIKEILNESKGEVMVCGHLRLSYSYRKFMEEEYTNKRNILKEESRNKDFLYYQSDKGSFIYQKEILYPYEYLDLFKDNTVLIRSFGLSNQEIIEAVNTVSDMKEGKPYNGFYDKESRLRK